jgi:hypothetical protein
MAWPRPAGAKVFCFFFFKKKRLLGFLKKSRGSAKGVEAGFRRHDVEG